MTWEEIGARTRKATGSAAEKLGSMADLAVLKLQLRTEKMRLRSAYEDFGEIAYLSFTSEDEDGAAALAEYIKAITLIKEQISTLEKQIRAFSQPAAESKAVQKKPPQGE